MKIVCDIGGTKTRIAKSINNELGDIFVFDTPQKYEGGLNEIIKYIKKYSDCDSVVIGIAGNIDKTNNTLVFSPNLPQWVGKNIILDIKKEINADNVKIENDTALAGLGEAEFGAGKGFDIVVYITVSTGVGGVRIVNGKIDTNRFGFEPGHQIVDADGTMDKTQHSHLGLGHLDNLISGKALFESTGIQPKCVSDEELWKRRAKDLAVGLYNTILHWSPDVVVLGGSMITGKPCIEIPEVEKNLKELMQAFPKLPEIKMAELGDERGLIGASLI